RACDTARRTARRRGVGEAEGQLAAVGERWRFHQLADAAGRRARQVRVMDLGTQGRHRQPAGRFRVCEDRGVAIRPSTPSETDCAWGVSRTRSSHFYELQVYVCFAPKATEVLCRCENVAKSAGRCRISWGDEP